MATGTLPFLCVKTTPPDLEQFPHLYATSQRFSAGKPRTFQISEDGSCVLFCRARSQSDPALCLWRFDVTNGTEHLLVDPADQQLSGSELSSAERQRRERARESGAGIVSYRLSNAGKACFVLGQALYVLDVVGGDVQKLETESSVFDPRFSPDGLHVGYVHGRDVRVITLARPRSDRLVFESPSDDVSIGRADFIAAEEIGRSRGFWWSPDSQQILAARVDETDVERWWITQPSHPDASPRSLRYPPAGGTNGVTSLLLGDVDDAEGTPPTSFAISPFEYLVDINWSDSSGPLVTRQSRDQREVSIDQLDVVTKELRHLRTITDDTWVDLVPGTPRQTAAGLLTVENQKAAASDKIYKAICIDGKAVTSSGCDVASVLSVHSRGDRLVAAVSVWSPPTSRTLAFVDVATGHVQPIGDSTGTNMGVFTGTTAVLTESSASKPGSTSTVHRTTDETFRPTHTIKSFEQTAGFKIDPTWISVDDGAIEIVVFLPADHDGTTPLPVLMDPYGGPHARRVTDSHDGHLVSQWFANHGYAVVVADGAGTPGRGVHLEHRVWGDVATPVLADQVRALDVAAERFGFFDLERVAIRGWSFGGYLAALAVLARPDRFHCAISGAPVTSWRLYDTHYTERYLGHPETHPENYVKTDLIRLAESLPKDQARRPLLLIHGLADDNVVAAHSLQLSTALLGSGYPHQVLPLSGVTHSPRRTVAENLLRLQLDFLTKATQN